MYFHITADSAELVEPQDVTSFSVVCPADLGDDALAASVQRADLGELLPGGGHLIVAVDAIRRMAADRVGPGWPGDLEKMVDYAVARGWADADGTRVRAHVERR